MTDGMVRTLLKKTAPGIVFAAHGVAREFKDRFIESVHISQPDFESIVEYLLSLDFDFLTVPQVVELSKKNFKHSKHWCHLSFDDGYQNNFDTVYPFLKALKIPFSVYVSTHYVETGDYFPTFYMRLAETLNKDLKPLIEDPSHLSADEIRAAAYKAVMFAPIGQFDAAVDRVKALFTAEEKALVKNFYNDRPLSLECLREMAADPLVHIGSHNHRHAIMHAGQNLSEMRAEIEQSFDRLIRRWRVSEAPTFCYPNGNYTAVSTKVCEELNIPLVLLTESGFVGEKTYALRVPRFWLATKNRTRWVSRLALLGDLGIYLCGRRPPAGVRAA